MIKPYNTDTFKIGDNEYHITAFRATEGLMLLNELICLGSQIGKGFSSVIASFIDGGTINTDEIEPAINEFLSNLQVALTDTNILSLIKRLTKNCNVNTSPDENQTFEPLENDRFDLVFSCNYEDLFILLKEVIVLNFLSRSFIKDKIAAMMKKQTNTSVKKK